jgi:hypothetical protein
MKLTSPKTIQDGEKEFIDSINAELDWAAIEKILFEKHNLTLHEEIEYKNGDLLVYKDQIAYKFDFEIKVPLSVIFNREGECLELSTLREGFEEEQGRRDEDEPVPPSLSAGPEDKVAKMAMNIADMISEINQGDE